MKGIRKKHPVDEEEERRHHAEALTHHYLMDGNELAALADVEDRFIIDQVLLENSVNFIYGLPESAKTWIAYSMLMSAVTGHSWLDLEVQPRTLRSGKQTRQPRTAMVFNFDNPAKTLAKRWGKLGLRKQSRAAQCVLFHTIGMQPKATKLPEALKLPAHYDDIMALLDYHRPDVVLIDGFRSSFIGNENNEEAAAVVSMFRSFSSLASSFHTGAAVIVLHHPKKTQKDDVSAPGENMRGSGEILAGIDVSIQVTKLYERKGLVRSEAELVKKKTWDGDKWKKTIEVIDLDEKNTAVRLFDQTEAIKWLLMQKGPMNKKQIGEALGIKGVALARATDAALESGAVEELTVSGRTLLGATKNRRNPEDSGG